MAIKIIKRGKLLKSPVRFICLRCGCIFDADGESLSIDLDARGYSPELDVCARCPTCERECRIREWQLSDE